MSGAAAATGLGPFPQTDPFESRPGCDIHTPNGYVFNLHMTKEN